MHLGRVVGAVVASVKTPHLIGHRLLLVQPYTYEQQKDGDVFVAVDLVSAGPGEWVFYVKSREAANALPNPFNPVDRTIMGIVDQLHLESIDAEPLPG